jgi:subtilisin family serine protease
MKPHILCLAGFLLISSLAPAATPTIVWSTKSIDSPMFPGLQLSRTVFFSSSSRLSNITLAVVPALQPFVAVTPSAFGNIIPGQSYPVTIVISVPESSPVQVLYSGTVQVKQGSTTVPATLKINVEVDVAAAQVPDPTSVVQDANGNLFPVNELIVDLNDSVTRQDAAEVASQVTGSIVGFVPSTNAYQVRLQTNSVAELDSAINILLTDPRVEGVYKNFAVSFFDVLSDMTNLRTCEVVNPTLAALGKDLLAPYDRVEFQGTWNLIQLDQPALHQVLIGIIDSGINRNHQEFTNPQVDTGTQNPSSPADGTGHGTAISGIIGANNAAVQTVNCLVNASAFQMTGIVGGVPGLSYALRIQGVDLFKFPHAFQASFSASIDNLANERVSVINISWGTYLASTAYFAEQLAAHSQILFVMAAGNKGIDASSVVPANVKLPNTITVGATDQDDARAVFNPPFVPSCFFSLFDDCSSNFGSVVDIAAPGTDIWAPATNCSTNINSCYALEHGTSFSAPFVTGAAAILKAIEGATPSKTLTPQQIKSILISNADPIQTGEPSKRLGTGCYASPSDPVNTGCRLNILRAVQQALSPPSATRIYVGVPAENRIAVVDPGSDQVIDSIPLPSAPQGIAISRDGSFLLAVLPNAGQLAKVHLPDKIVTQMNITGAGAVAILTNGQKAYVTQNTATGTSVSVIDPSTLTLTKSITLAGAGSVVNNINIAPSGLKAYVSFGGIDTTVGVIDTALDQLKATINAQTYYHDEVAFSADSSLAVVSSRGANCPTNGGFSQLDAVNDVFLSADNLTSGKIGVKVSTDKTKAYLPDTCGAGNLLVFDLAMNTLADSIPTGLTNEPSAILLFENTGKAFLVDETGTMSDVDLNARSHFTFPLSTAPFGGILPWTVTSGPAPQ